MKRFLILFGLLFCTAVFAETITINWGVNNQTYTTTTCETGNDVILPATPTKRGHVFKGWVAEHFNRGTFANWVVVPTTETGYLQNIYGNQTPLKGDYIIVSDAGDYVSSFKSFVAYKKTSTWDVYINGTKLTENVGNVVDGIMFYFTRNNGLRCDSIMVIDGVQYAPQSVYPTFGNFSSVYGNEDNPITIQVDDSPIKYSGTWKFVYDGFWATDGKSGWKPSEQIISE